MFAARRHVAAALVFEAHQSLSVALQLAVSVTAPARVDETMEVSCDGSPVAWTEIATTGGRLHVVNLRPGRYVARYTATVTGQSALPPVADDDYWRYLQPSRFVESDRLATFAQAEFAGISGSKNLLAAVSSWVGSHLSYVPGSSGATDGAVDTLVHRQGVCRDYAHLVIAFLRALGVPARMAAVYAPGLHPMDFHAVAEALIDRAWRVVDATLLAPRASLLRIATGRDATDTAFLSCYDGALTLLEAAVTAVIDGDLPNDTVTELASLR